MKKLFQTLGKNIPLLLAISSAILSIISRNKIIKYFFGSFATSTLATSAYLNMKVAEEDNEGEISVSGDLKLSNVEGILMRWEEHGAADNIHIVFLHGIPTGPRLWRYVIPRLSMQGARCYAWNLVGYGDSWQESFKHDISVKKQAEYLHMWLRSKNINKAIFVGHDLGGGVVQRFAVDHPGYCMGVVLIDCVAYDNWPIKMMGIVKSFGKLVENTPHYLLKPFLFSSLIQIGHDNKSRGLKSLNLHWKHYAHKNGSKAFIKQVKSLHTHDTQSIANKLPDLNLPAKVIWGEEDPLGTKYAKRLADDLKGELTIIPGAKHFTPEDHPDIIGEKIRNLLVEVARNVPVR